MSKTLENKATAMMQMQQRIFDATQEVMANVGVHGVSIQKIAKAAGISVGTIYLYFKNKEELLLELAHHIWGLFQDVLADNYQPDEPLYWQYEQMWWNVWHFLHSNPTVIVNLGQYASLPGMAQICQARSSVWQNFCQKGIDDGVLVNFAPWILWNLSMETVLSLSQDSLLRGVTPTESELTAVVSRSFAAIKLEMID